MASTEITLRYWSKAIGLTSNPLILATEIERVYVNVAGARDSIGYFEQLTTAGERGHGSDYDRHRHLKGDSAVTTGIVYRWVGPAGIDAAIIAVIDSQRPAAFADIKWPIPAAAARDDWELFRSLAGYAAGGPPAWYGNSSKSAIAAVKRARDAATYRIEV